MHTSMVVKVGVVVVLGAATVQVLVRVAPAPAVVTRSLVASLASEWRRPRPLTLLVAAVTTAVACWQAAWPGLLDHLARHHDTVSSGRWWQFATELVVQSPLWQAPITIGALLVVGTTVERLAGPVRWLLLYAGGAAAGEAAAMAWQPEGAGNSIAVLGLLGGLFAFFLRDSRAPRESSESRESSASRERPASRESSESRERPASRESPASREKPESRERPASRERPESRGSGIRLLVAVALAGAFVLVYYHDIHGPALLAGALLGLVLVSRESGAVAGAPHRGGLGGL